MDDKAYLRPGTEDGARDTKAGVVSDVVDPLKARKLPQHDFNQAQVNQTPASFRFIKGHVEEIENKNNLVNDNDQTIVIIRPKYYIGSSGSVWASDYLRICHEHPSLFQESRQSAISNTLNKFVCHIHDILFYFVEITMKEDVQSPTTEPSCPFRKYEEEKLEWLLQQIEVAVLAWREEKEGIPEQEKTIGNNLENSTVRIQEKAAFYKQGCCELIRGKELWDKLENLSNTCSEILQEIQKSQILNMCCDILKATDAGPGVGVSNVEVLFRCRDSKNALLRSSKPYPPCSWRLWSE